MTYFVEHIVAQQIWIFLLIMLTMLALVIFRDIRNEKRKTRSAPRGY
jgi:Tfp pilus assembly protein PilX